MSNTETLTPAEQRLLPELATVAAHLASLPTETDAVAAAPGEPVTAYSNDGTVRVEFWYCDEGLCGDYDPGDPTDVALLRFDAAIRRDAVPQTVRITDALPDDPDVYVLPVDSSYCTNLPAIADPLIVRETARVVAERLSCEIDGGTWKRACEELSWVDHTWVAPSRSR